MPRKTITVQVKMNRKTLRSFAVFDTFVLKKQWRRPVMFALILLAFAFACFFLIDKEQHMLIGSVLTAVAVSLPFSYVFMFLSGVKEQAQKLRLPRRVYTLVVMEDFIRITNDMKAEEALNLPWDQVHALHRRKNAIYLYVTPQKAFILPNGQADAPVEELWQMLTSRATEAKAKK